MNHEFLITAIPGITIISCSVSCCLAEVCPRRKCKKNPFNSAAVPQGSAEKEANLKARKGRNWALSSAGSARVVSAARFKNNRTHSFCSLCFVAHLQFVPNSESFQKSVFNEFWPLSEFQNKCIHWVSRWKSSPATSTVTQAASN